MNEDDRGYSDVGISASMISRQLGLSVVIPAYGSSSTLRDLCGQLLDEVGPRVNAIEIIIVDDGSGDGTWDSIRALAAEHVEVRGVQLLRNYGQHNALLAGLRLARFDLVLTIDDDLQHPPREVARLLDALTADLDLVYGRPTQERQGAMRNLASKVSKRMMAIGLGPEVHPRSGAFRLFRRDLVAAADDVHDPSISIDVLLSWATNRIDDVEVTYDERAGGRSGYTARTLLRHAANMITGYSTRPLRWVSAFGFLCAMFGFALLGYILVRYLIDGSEVAG
ncbi:glycosyltransferase family 2 protein, partial [Ilumatobacter sp.]|uniref:glycosyltransferase family 2 protein n=1 Tax=Ilumatobacter sp. TaxID=1967498 RepID=UPI003C6EF4BF